MSRRLRGLVRSTVEEVARRGARRAARPTGPMVLVQLQREDGSWATVGQAPLSAGSITVPPHDEQGRRVVTFRLGLTAPP